MRRSWRLLTGIVIGLAAHAQGDVRLAGRITNENNAPLAGALIVVRAALPLPEASFRAYTDPVGAFSLALQHPGRYLVDVEREGYFPLKDRPVELGLGTTEADFVLSRLREVFESVEVSAVPPSIDMDRTSAEESVTGNQILNVPYPTTNSLRNALRIVPGVVQDSRGGLHVNGGHENQVLYTLDGFNVTDPLTGRFDTRLSVESVQSVDVASGRFSAEYGKGSAGALAVYTKSGDDKLRYSATNFVPGVESRKGLIIGSWTPRVNVSGPLRKGRAWFSDSFDTQYIHDVIEELPKGEDRTYNWRFSNLLNTQVNLTPSNILYTGFLVNFWTAPRTGLSALDPRETTVDRRSRQWFFHVKDQMYLGRRTVLEVGYARNRTFGREIPQGGDFYILTPEGKRGNYFVDATRKAGRDQVLANLFLPSFTYAGGHQLKTGVDWNRLSYWQDARRTGFENYDESLIRLRRTVFGGNGRLSRTNYELSAYLQDSWRLRPGLVLEVGLRSDWDRILRVWSLSPRLGAAWSPPRLENTKISAGYAVVHDSTNLGLFTRPQDQYSLTTYFEPDGAIERGPAVSVFTIEDHDLARPRYHNYTLGLEQNWPGGIQTRFDYLRKRGRWGFTYANVLGENSPPPADWETIFLNPQFDAIYNLSNRRRDVFDSFQAAVRQSFRRQYEWMASYTRSRALSNAVADISIDDPIIIGNNVGPMPWDTPNRFLSWGYLPTLWQDWAVAYLLEWRTGFPFSAATDEGRVIGDVNSFRFPAFFELNLHFERRFAFRNNRWAFRFGCNNITNHRNPNVVNNTVTSVNFLRFFGGQGRSLNFRIRWLGKS